MPKLTQAEKGNLEDEIFWCKENIKNLNNRLQVIISLKGNLNNEIYSWKKRFKKADRKLAFDSKLTVCKKGGKKKENKDENITNALKIILSDKDKLRKLINALEKN